MTQEQEGQLNKLRTIHIDLEQRSAQIEFQDGTVERWIYNSEGIFRSLLQSGSLESEARRLLATSQPETGSAEAVEQLNDPAPARREKAPSQVLSGRLQGQPREGNPDGNGKPTAWAKFLAHIEGHEGAVWVSATFHNQTRPIALQLPAGSQITAQGYYHEARGSGRNPTFSIFHLINYEGKAARPK